MNTKAFFPLLLATSLAALITMAGCATTARNTVKYINSGKAEIAYGMVFGEVDGKTAFERPCLKGTIAKSYAVTCADVNAYKFAKLYPYKFASSDVSIWLLVPSNVSTPDGSIIEFESTDNGVQFRRVVTEKETDTCRWTGFSSNNATRFATGFISAVTIVAAPIALGSDLMDGGVECNGWSYKDLIKKGNEFSNTVKAGTTDPDVM